MAGARRNLSAEVSKFLSNRTADYEAFLDDVVRDLVRFRDAGNADVLYRIYTRGDKQAGGRKLKSQDGLVKKLGLWLKTNPSVKVSDIHDIIGVTVVTYFASDVAQVLAKFRGNRFGSFDLIKEERKETEGYFADHLIVQRRAKGKPFAEPPLCEIQVKTLLHDGWAAKTHDLDYKTRILIQPEIRRQIQLMGQSVQTLEEQSDILRQLIRNFAELDRERRDTAVITLTFALTQADSTEANDQVGSLASEIIANRDHLKSCEDSDGILVDITDKWKDLQSKMGDCRQLCRCILLLAALRQTDDIDGAAIDAIEAWSQAASDLKDHATALAFKSLSHWVLGQLDDAVSAGEVAVNFAETNGLPTTGAKLNLAYYMSERVFAMTIDDFAEQRILIDQLQAGITKQADDRKQAAQLDSLGAIKIMTATTRDEVYEGQALCRQAKSLAHAAELDLVLFDHFYELHERRAAQKLLELG